MRSLDPILSPRSIAVTSDQTAEADPTPPKPAAPKPTPKPVPAKPAAKDPADTVMAVLKREVTKARQQQQARDAGATPPTDPTEPTVTDATETSLPDGPPLTSSEKDGLRLAVQRCWNVPAGLRDANQLKVTLAAELAADGAVINASIRLIDPSPAPDARFQQAYEAGRRALIRCSPYSDLPRDKFGQWRDIEVVFNPEGMVSW